MTIRVRFVDADLRNVRLWPQPGPIDGATTAARRISGRGWTSRGAGVRAVSTAEMGQGGRLDFGIARLAVELLSLAGRPDFVDVHAATVDAAVGRLLGATRREMTDSFHTLAARGVELPSWTVDLANGDRRLRVELARSIRHLYDVEVRPRLAMLQPLADVAHRRRLQDLADGGIDRLFNRLHPRLQWHPPRTLEFTIPDSAVDFQVDSHGTGVVLVPAPWPGSRPSVLLPDGADTQPMMIFYPADPMAVQAHLRYDVKRLGELLGTTRARMLLCIAERPGLSTHELAAVVGVSPASASEHTSVLRRNRLVVTTQVAHRAEHAITSLGAQLLT